MAPKNSRLLPMMALNPSFQFPLSMLALPARPPLCLRSKSSVHLFFALSFANRTVSSHSQSCLNHSCVPNVALVKSSGDIDGRVVVRTLRDIRPGEELAISYIDEALPYEERREELQEYHFLCRYGLDSAEVHYHHNQHIQLESAVKL